VQAALGTVPDGVDEYFSSRFPRLLIDTYHVIGYHCREDFSFEKYYPASYAPKFQIEEEI
jgi:serine/threonine-protein kinase/endoribonuclease IRE1